MNFLYALTFLALLMLMVQLSVRVWLMDESIAKVVIPVLIAVFAFLVFD